MKLYGTKVSRALRSIWAAEEVGVDYEWIPTSFLAESKTPEYLALNPNGRIPALVDGDLVLFESMAINLYLAKTYGGKLYPSDPHDEARANQWTIWGMTELEPHLIPMVLHKVMLPEDQRDPAIVAKAEAEIERPLAVLDAHVSDREYLLGGDFTIADLNLAGALATSNFANYDISKFENATRWMSRCTGRPSFARTQAK
jgi:glutathione S-transferase